MERLVEITHDQKQQVSSRSERGSHSDPAGFWAVGVILAALVLWCIASAMRLQKALCWWSARQNQRYWDQSDQIINHLLQDLFIMRRELELNSTDKGNEPNPHAADWVKRFEQVYHSLHALSDCLIPPYVEESLPLAIQALIKLRCLQCPNVNFGVDLPSHWHSNSTEQNRLILTLLDELLRITVLAVSAPLSLSIRGGTRQDAGELIVQITYPDWDSLSKTYRSVEIEYWKQVFQFFVSGWCLVKNQELAVTWRLRWRL